LGASFGDPPRLSAPHLGHRVDTSVAQRLTTQQSPESEEATMYDAMPLDRLDGIARTCRMKSTVLPEEWAQEVLIRPDH
jgi:hypothetical protein